MLCNLFSLKWDRIVDTSVRSESINSLLWQPYVYLNYYYYLIELQVDFARWQWSYNKTQRNTQKYTCRTKQYTMLKQNTTHSYTNNSGHITHNEYNTWM
jgi:hypothetical protein